MRPPIPPDFPPRVVCLRRKEHPPEIRPLPWDGGGKDGAAVDAADDEEDGEESDARTPARDGGVVSVDEEDSTTESMAVR